MIVQAEADRIGWDELFELVRNSPVPRCRIFNIQQRVEVENDQPLPEAKRTSLLQKLVENASTIQLLS